MGMRTCAFNLSRMATPFGNIPCSFIFVLSGCLRAGGSRGGPWLASLGVSPSSVIMSSDSRQVSNPVASVTSAFLPSTFQPFRGLNT